MPLPDERPRQSVANLIGRFEVQIQRQPSSTPSSRSTSVISHTTGDSAKEELKEKREWPPTSIYSSSPKPPPIVPSSSWTRSQSHQASAPPESQATQPEPVEEASQTPRPASTTSIPDAAKAAQSQQQLMIAVSTKLVTSTSTPTPTTAKPIKTPIAKAAPKTPSKSTPRMSVNHVTQPLKPQHTGPASLSTPSVRKSVTRAPTTPASTAKIPPRTPATVPRPKTPAIATTTRPKTPSTGLFAPTAASLARMRNAQPQPATPPKKVLSSSAAERLGKPTAASLSRARAPVAAAPAPPKSGVRGGALSRGTAKPGVTSKAKKDTPPVPKVPKAGIVPAAVAVPPVPDAENPVADDHPFPTSPGDSVNGDGTTIEQNPVDSDAHPAEEAEGHGGTAEDPEPTSPAPEHEAGQTVGHVELAKEFHDDTTTETVEDILVKENDAKSSVPVGNDIEDMVNLLESASFSNTRPQSIAIIPDEVAEIPDEI